MESSAEARGLDNIAAPIVAPANCVTISRLHHIAINGAIESDLPKLIRRDLSLVDFDHVSLVVVSINTNGGNAAAAFAVYEALRSLPCPVVTEVSGRCESAGMDIFMAGDYRRVHCTAALLLHETHVGIGSIPGPIAGRANASDLRRALRRCEESDARSFGTFALRTGKPEAIFREEAADEELTEMSRGIDYGLVHEIIGVTPRPSMSLFEQMRRVSAVPRVYVPRWQTCAGYRSAALAADLEADLIATGPRQ